MKTRIQIFLFIAVLVLSSCHKSTCPAFDPHAGERALKGSTGKAKSSVYPKNMAPKKK